MCLQAIGIYELDLGTQGSAVGKVSNLNSSHSFHWLTAFITSLLFCLQEADDTKGKAAASAAPAAGKNKGKGPINGTSAAEKRKQAAEAAKKAEDAAVPGTLAVVC